VPMFVSHFRGNAAAQDQVIAAATALRETLDAAVFRAYQRGCRPSRFSKARVRAKARALNDLFDGPNCDVIEAETLGAPKRESQ